MTSIFEQKNISNGTRVILHMDGDAFFVGVEMAKNPKLKDRPVVTGEEKGIVTALSYEAKALGVVRGMPVFRIKRDFPQVIILPGDYQAYAQYSKLHQRGVLYRTTGVTLNNLISDNVSQGDLFGNSAKADKFDLIHKQIDSLEEKFGKRVVYLASTQKALKKRKKTAVMMTWTAICFFCDKINI